MPLRIKLLIINKVMNINDIFPYNLKEKAMGIQEIKEKKLS